MISVYKTEGIILRSADWGELNRLITIYTKQQGKISARAISVRKKESKLKGLLLPFTRANFLLARSKSIDIVTDVEILDSYLYLHNNLKSLSCAFYFSELVDKLVSESERDENLWRLAARVFDVLNQKRDDLPEIKRLFEEKLLEFLGYQNWQNEGAKNKTAADFIRGLLGEEIKAERFLRLV